MSAALKDLTGGTSAGPENAPLRMWSLAGPDWGNMFAVDDLDDTLARLRRHGAQLVDEVVHIGLAEPIG